MKVKQGKGKREKGKGKKTAVPIRWRRAGSLYSASIKKI
jgi:hypothetical protein